MTKCEYNGWTNYETWAVKLWMDNEQASQEYWSEAAKMAFKDACASSSFTQCEQAAFDLAHQLKSEHEAALPEVEGFAADLLNAAVSEVNWHEIAVSLLKEVESEHISPVEAVQP